MKAAVFEAANKVVVKDVPEPVPEDNEVIIEVKACGVCGSDVHTFKGDFIGGDPYPLIPGHEFCGVIVETGKDVSDFKPGDKVAVDPVLPCGKCYFCKRNEQNHCESFEALGDTVAGGFAEKVAVPEANLFKFDSVSFKEAALAEPLACVVYGHQRASVNVGDDVLIFGAGPIGLLHLQVAVNTGAARVVVVDLVESKLELAKRLGASVTLNPELENKDKLFDIAPHGFDLVIDATGVPQVVEDAIKYVKNHSRLMVFGVNPQEARIDISPYEIFRRDIDITGVFALNRTLGKALKLIDNRIIKTEELIADVIPLEDLARALKLIEKGEAEGKFVIKPEL